jgi:hypothetical protein
MRRLPWRHLSVSLNAEGERGMLALGLFLGLAAAQPAPLSGPPPPVLANDLFFEEHVANRRSLWSASPLLSRYPRLLRILREEALPEVRLTADDCVETMPCHSSIHHELTFAGTRLITVFGEYDGFHGGAHGSHSASGHVWDRQLGRMIRFQDLFVDWARAEPILQAKFCESLRSRRAESPHIECPAIADVAIGLSDRTGIPTGGRAYSFELRTSDYQLGSYADGRETVWIDAEPDVLALVKPDYRVEFMTYE